MLLHKRSHQICTRLLKRECAETAIGMFHDFQNCTGSFEQCYSMTMHNILSRLVLSRNVRLPKKASIVLLMALRGGWPDTPTVVPEQVNKIQRRKRSKEVLHVEQQCKAEGSWDFPALLYKRN